MPAIFISYRRDDSGGHAGALARELGHRFGAENVFLDLDDIRGGADFVTTLEQALGRCDVLIAVIGRQWLAAADAQGRRRLDVPRDVVRMEIAAALRRNVAVIPVLVEDAPMPSASDLPEDLQPLAVRNAMHLRNASWQHDVDKLADELRAVFYSPRPGMADPPIPPDFRPGNVFDRRKGLLVGLFAAIGVVFTGIGGWSFVETRRFIAHAAVADGRVIENVPDGGTYRAIVRFEPPAGAPVTFRSSAGSDPPSYGVGEIVRVLYDAADPSDARISSWFSLWGFATIFSALGVAGLAVSAGLIATAVRRHRRQLALIRSGHPIMTVFDSVEQNVKFTYNGRHPYRIVTKWRNPISGEIATFRSQDLWDDPTEQVKHRSITVLVDPGQLSNYVMDVSMVRKAK
ncbi:MAG TPA: DUF3592 domain-containing protein [Vicinamibacterales bacterium]|nr:DUF3592 domain-containing protein [Vicinamibacterales bacterium]